ELGREALEDPQLGVERLAGVQIPAVLAVPEERLAAGDALDVRDVHAAAAHASEPLLAEVLADRPHHAHVLEEGGGQREMHRGPPEHPLALAERGLDGVIGDWSD